MKDIVIEEEINPEVKSINKKSRHDAIFVSALDYLLYKSIFPSKLNYLMHHNLYIHIPASVREATTRIFFLVARPLRGAGEGKALVAGPLKKNFFCGFPDEF